MSLAHYGPSSRRSVDDAERPFWISYADLMTALMILFLVIMVAALSSITKKAEQINLDSQKISKVITDRDEPNPLKVTDAEKRVQEIASICKYLSDKVAGSGQPVFVDCKLNRINFGEAGRFATDDYKLDAKGEEALLKTIPLILSTAHTELGKKWLKQVLIEGYTDTDGSYLYNLNLSLKRSEWVMCTLLSDDRAQNTRLTPNERKEIKKLFLAGGVAFNNIQNSKDASRRVELRLQFYGLGKVNPHDAAYEAKFDDSTKERCML